MTEITTTLVLRAALFAAERHRGQFRKGADASPYINHPLSVAALLAGEGGVTDPVVLAAALLHDTIEDTATSRAEIEAGFGPAVAAVVAEVTDDTCRPKVERKRLQVLNAPGKSAAAKQVKLADKICNLRDIASCPPLGWDRERRLAYYDHARAVVAGLRGANPALEALFDQIDNDGRAAILAND